MPAILLHYFQSFTINEQLSTNEKRVVIVTLSNGNVLPPVLLKVPAYATSADVDAFIEDVRSGTTPSPLRRAARLVQDIMVVANPMLINAQTAVQASKVIEASEGLQAAINLIQAANQAVNGHQLEDEAGLDAAFGVRREIFSQAAMKVTTASNTMIEVLRDLQDAGGISEERFSSDVQVVSLNAFKVRVLRHGFKSQWFV